MENSLRIQQLPTLRDQIVDRLREWIVTGRFPPGTRLVERELCEQMGVSRTSLREAMRSLENEGLVTVLPHRGPIVTKVSATTAEEIYQVRAALEGMASRLFCRNASDEEIEGIKACYRRLEKISGKEAPREYLEAKEVFYDLLLKGSRNAVATEMLGIVLRRVSQLRSISVNFTDRAEESKQELKALVDALAARDEEAAWRACIQHVENASAALLIALEHQRNEAG